VIRVGLVARSAGSSPHSRHVVAETAIVKAISRRFGVSWTVARSAVGSAIDRRARLPQIAMTMPPAAAAVASTIDSVTS
jgi:hypothetical protein